MSLMAFIFSTFRCRIWMVIEAAVPCCPMRFGMSWLTSRSCALDHSSTNSPSEVFFSFSKLSKWHALIRCMMSAVFDSSVARCSRDFTRRYSDVVSLGCTHRCCTQSTTKLFKSFPSAMDSGISRVANSPLASSKFAATRTPALGSSSCTFRILLKLFVGTSTWSCATVTSNALMRYRKPVSQLSRSSTRANCTITSSSSGTGLCGIRESSETSGLRRRISTQFTCVPSM
mmetsp:Transcript_44748/g.83590  ORF Transcript_44748/g.83590 Transcript_44748/m.83590 type:complete len:230 (-) Transcript_44748:234-923(-)